MSECADDDVAAVRKELVAYGGDTDGTIHSSWRCFDKDRYPDTCHCLDDISRDILAAVAPAIAARALQEAADEIDGDTGGVITGFTNRLRALADAKVVSDE